MEINFISGLISSQDSLFLKLFRYLCLLGIAFISPFFKGGNDDYILALIFFLGGIFLILALSGKRCSGISADKNPCIFVALIFLFAIFLSNFFSVSPYNIGKLILYDNIQFLFYFSWFYFLEILLFVLIFIALYSINFPPNFFEKFILIFLAVSLILSLAGIYFYETGAGGIMSSTFLNSNAFASYLLFSLPFAIYFFLAAKENEKKLIFCLIALILFSAFILTNSRGAYLSFIPSFIILLFLFLSRENKKEILKKVILFFLILIIFVTFLISIKNEKLTLFSIHSSKVEFETTGEKIELNIFDRLTYWKGAISMLKERPLFGWGLSSFGDIYPRYQPLALSYAKYPHNYYLQILAESGIIGAFPFFLFIFLLIYFGLKQDWQLLERDEGGRAFLTFPNSILCLLFFLSILSSAIHNFVDFGWTYRANFLTFFIVAGLFLNLNRRLATPKESLRLPTGQAGDRQQATGNGRDNSFFGYLLPVVGCLLIVISLILTYSFCHFRKGESLEKSKRYIEAIGEYQKGTRVNPNPNYLLREGILLYSKGDINEAEKIAKTALKLNKENDDIWRLLARIEEKKNSDIAEDYFKKALEINPYFADVYLDLARFYERKEKYNEAVAILDKGIEKYDKDSISQFKRFRKSAAYILGIKEEEFELTPLEEVANLYYERGKIEEKIGSKEKAEIYSQKAEEIKRPL